MITKTSLAVVALFSLMALPAVGFSRTTCPVAAPACYVPACPVVAPRCPSIPVVNNCYRTVSRPCDGDILGVGHFFGSIFTPRCTDTCNTCPSYY